MSLGCTDSKGKLPPDWKWAKLSEVAHINPRKSSYISYSPDTPTTFVPMESVDGETGTIASPETRPLSEVSKGYTYFEEGDVLFAKITPCMQNGKHALARDLINGMAFGTTEFHIVRPGSWITSDWVHKFLRQPSVLEEATRYFRGAVGQQRVPKEFLVDLSIPLPPLSEQKRIIAILNEQMAAVERAKKAAEERLEAAQALLRALLEHTLNAAGFQDWLEVPLGEIGSVASGITLGRKIKPGIPTHLRNYLRVANVKDGFLDLDDVKQIPASDEESRKYRLKAGDLLLTEGGDPDKLGRGCVWNAEIPNCLHQNHIFRVRFDQTKVNPKFVSSVAGSSYGKSYFLANARQTTGIATINRRILEAFPVRLPPIEHQNRIVADLDNVVRSNSYLADTVSKSAEATEAMPSVLLRRAFSGEL